MCLFINMKLLIIIIVKSYKLVTLHTQSHSISHVFTIQGVLIINLSFARKHDKMQLKQSTLKELWSLKGRWLDALLIPLQKPTKKMGKKVSPLG